MQKSASESLKHSFLFSKAQLITRELAIVN